MSPENHHLKGDHKMLEHTAVLVNLHAQHFLRKFDSQVCRQSKQGKHLSASSPQVKQGVCAFSLCMVCLTPGDIDLIA